MLPYNLQPIDVLALTWSDAEIKAYALSAATAAGAKTIANGGLKVAQALEQHEILAEAMRRGNVREFVHPIVAEALADRFTKR